MKNIFITLLLLCRFVVFSQPDIDEILNTARVGELYITFQQSENNEADSFYYAIIPPVFETYIDSIKKKEIPYGDIEVEYELVVQVYEKTPLTYSWIVSAISDTIAQSCLNRENFPNKPNFTIRKAESPARYISLVCYFIEKSNSKIDSVYYEYHLIERQRKITDETIKLLSDKDEILHPDQIIIAFSNGVWSDFKNIICPRLSTFTKITDIQIALNKKGYKCEVNGILDIETKAALVKFRRDNNIPDCCRVDSCNNLMFNKLGLEGY